ncbi:MAG: hypothetical protein H6811_09920 [Phycisphaeraceae bacterium]|nr:hypothetical protein [Phycisphaeraceae bacterium]
MTPRYHMTLLRAGRLLLDGGGMFGLIPRVVWSRSVDTDDSNRIELHHNCVLLVGLDPDPILKRPRRIILEAGTGDKLDPKMAAIFGLDGPPSESPCARPATTRVEHRQRRRLPTSTSDHAGS